MVKIKLIAVILTAFLAISALVAAETFSVSPTSLTFTNLDSIQSFEVSNSNASEVYNLAFSQAFITADSKTIPFVITGNTQNINASVINPAKFNISTTFTEYASLAFGKDYTGSLVITKNGTENKTISLIAQKSYCSSGEVASNLSITSVDIDNLGEGDDDAWKPLDEIEIAVEVYNNNFDEDDDIDTIVKLALYDSRGKELLKLDKKDLGKIDGGDSKTATFTFDVPSELGVRDSDYRLYIKAYQDGKEKDICTSKQDTGFYRTINVDREDDDFRLIVLDNIQVEPSSATCGSEAILSATVYNIGDENQDKIKINLINKELKVQEYVILDNFDMDDSEKDIEFRFNVPQNVSAKTYKLELKALYTYDNDYEEDDDAGYEDKADSIYADLKVESCGPAVVPQETISIDAALDSEAKAGEEIKVKATIFNEGDSSQSITILASGMESFSSLNRIEPSTFTLASGSSKDVFIYLDADDTAKGDYSFSIKAVYGGKMEEQPVSLTVEGKSAGFSISGMNKNWVIWAIVAVNIILLVLIIIVAVRLSRN